MRSKYTMAILLIISLSAISCRQETCPEACGAGIILRTVGFTHAQLTGAVISYYPANNTFAGATSSDSINVADWYHPSLDTTSDTLAYNGVPLNEAADLELWIPATNETYKITLTFQGGFNQNVDCFEGGKIAPCQGPYLTSYKVNGTSFSAQQDGVVYIYK